MADPVLMAQGTEQRRVILRELKTYIKTFHLAPSIDELADAAWLSPTTVRYHLGVLERQGWIKRTPGQHRSLRVIRHGRYVDKG